jgi:hypothetical protein
MNYLLSTEHLQGFLGNAKNAKKKPKIAKKDNSKIDNFSKFLLAFFALFLRFSRYINSHIQGFSGNAKNAKKKPKIAKKDNSRIDIFSKYLLAFFALFLCFLRYINSLRGTNPLHHINFSQCVTHHAS